MTLFLLGSSSFIVAIWKFLDTKELKNSRILTILFSVSVALTTLLFLFYVHFWSSWFLGMALLSVLLYYVLQKTRSKNQDSQEPDSDYERLLIFRPILVGLMWYLPWVLVIKLLPNFNLWLQILIIFALEGIWMWKYFFHDRHSRFESFGRLIWIIPMMSLISYNAYWIASQDEIQTNEDALWIEAPTTQKIIQLPSNNNYIDFMYQTGDNLYILYHNAPRGEYYDRIRLLQYNDVTKETIDVCEFLHSDYTNYGYTDWVVTDYAAYYTNPTYTIRMDDQGSTLLYQDDIPRTYDAALESIHVFYEMDDIWYFETNDGIYQETETGMIPVSNVDSIQYEDYIPYTVGGQLYYLYENQEVSSETQYYDSERNQLVSTYSIRPQTTYLTYWPYYESFVQTADYQVSTTSFGDARNDWREWDGSYAASLWIQYEDESNVYVYQPSFARLYSIETTPLLITIRNIYLIGDFHLTFNSMAFYATPRWILLGILLLFVPFPRREETTRNFAVESEQPHSPFPTIKEL